jgi:hypothetical protein
MIFTLFTLIVISDDPLAKMLKGFPDEETARVNREIATTWKRFVESVPLPKVIRQDALYRQYIWDLLFEIRGYGYPGHVAFRTKVFVEIRDMVDRHDKVTGRKDSFVKKRFPTPTPISLEPRVVQRDLVH